MACVGWFPHPKGGCARNCAPARSVMQTMMTAHSTDHQSCIELQHDEGRPLPSRTVPSQLPSPSRQTLSLSPCCVSSAPTPHAPAGLPPLRRLLAWLRHKLANALRQSSSARTRARGFAGARIPTSSISIPHNNHFWRMTMEETKLEQDMKGYAQR